MVQSRRFWGPIKGNQTLVVKLELRIGWDCRLAQANSFSLLKNKIPYGSTCRVYFGELENPGILLHLWRVGKICLELSAFCTQVVLRYKWNKDLQERELDLWNRAENRALDSVNYKLFSKIFHQCVMILCLKVLPSHQDVSCRYADIGFHHHSVLQVRH